MKITGQSIQRLNIQGIAVNNVKKSESKSAPKSDSSQITHPVPNDITLLQQDIQQSRRMFGALTVLADSIEIFQREPGAYEQNVKAAIEN